MSDNLKKYEASFVDYSVVPPQKTDFKIVFDNGVPLVWDESTETKSTIEETLLPFIKEMISSERTCMARFEFTYPTSEGLITTPMFLFAFGSKNENGVQIGDNFVQTLAQIFKTHNNGDPLVLAKDSNNAPYFLFMAPKAQDLTSTDVYSIQKKLYRSVVDTVMKNLPKTHNLNMYISGRSIMISVVKTILRSFTYLTETKQTVQTFRGDPNQVIIDVRKAIEQLGVELPYIEA